MTLHNGDAVLRAFSALRCTPAAFDETLDCSVMGTYAFM
jgi:hypothetical protein